MPKNLFDFSDVSDLPESLQEKVQGGTAGKAQEFADIVAKGAEAGMPELTIKQIIAVYIRMGNPEPKQTTVRSYLNKAVELGLLTKPSNTTYGAPDTKGKTKAAEVETAEPDPVVSAEPELQPNPEADLPEALDAEAAEPELELAPEEDDDPLASLGL